MIAIVQNVQRFWTGFTGCTGLCRWDGRKGRRDRKVWNIMGRTERVVVLDRILGL